MRMIAGLVSALGLVVACGGFDPDSEAWVRVSDRAGNAVVDADVWSHDAAGARIARTTTDADGAAIVPVESGGAVTVHADYWLGPSGAEWRTRLGIAPGDELDFIIQGAFVEISPREPTGITELTLPPLPPDTWRVEIGTPCGRVNSFLRTQTVTLESHCDGPTTVVATLTNSAYATIGYAVVRDVDLRTTPSVVIPGAWEVPSATWTLDLRGVPAGLTNVSAKRALAAPLRTDTAHEDRISRYDVPVSDMMIDAPRPDIADPAHYLVEVGSWGEGARYVVSTNEASVDGITVDLGTIARPALEFSADGAHASWTTMADADLVTVEQVVTATMGDVIEPYWTWHVTAPPATTTFDFFGDVGFPFVGTPASMNAHFDHFAVSAWDASWFPPYEELRTRASPPPPPADAPYTLRSGGDAFEDDRRAYPPW